jgi:fibronectin-binding autotransporter adhesin
MSIRSSRLKRAVALSAAVATALASSGTFGAVIYTDTSTSGNWSAAAWTVTNGTGNTYPQSTDAGNIAEYNTATTAASLVLDVPVTIGALENINSGNFAITGTTNSFTLDNTGGAPNPLGDTNGFIGTTSSGTLTVAPNIVIANTPLDIGTTGSGAVSLTGSITGNGNLFFDDNGSGGSTVSGGVNNVGTITNSGTGAGNTALSGVIGTNVTSIIQNSATSTLTLSGANTFTGTVQVLAGTLALGVTSGNVGAPIGTSTVNSPITLGASSGSANATLKYAAGGKAATYYNAINVAAGSTGQLEIYNNSGAATFNGAVTLNNNLLLYNDNNGAGSGSYLTFTGGFTGTGNLTIGGGGTGTGAGSNILLTTNAVNMVGSILYNAAPNSAVTDTISAPIGTNVTGLTVNGSAKNSTLALTGANTFTSPTNVVNGTLALGSGGSLAGTTVTIGNTAATATTVGDLKVLGNFTIGTTGSGSLTVGGSNASNTSTAGVNGIFSLVDGTFNTLTINNSTAGATALTLGGATTPTTLNMEFGGGNADKISLGAGLAASINPGGVVINLTNLAAGNPGTQTLISAPGGGLTGGGSFTLGTITNYGGYSSITLNTSSTAVTLTETAGAATPQYAYWKGTQGTAWNLFTGGTANNSNFTSDPAGTTDTHQSPGSTTNVFFTANTATNLNTTLGEPFTINSLSFTGTGTQAATSAVTIGGTYPLTINAAAGFTDSQSTPVTYNAGTGIVVQPGSIGQTISAPVVLGASQTWEIDNAASTPLVVSGVISGTGTVLTKTGAGTLNLTNGANTLNGGITVSGGTLNASGGGGKTSLGTGVATINIGATLNALGADAFGYGGGGPGTYFINGGTVTDVSGTSAYRITLTNLNFTGGTLAASSSNAGDVSGNYSLGGGSIVTNAASTTASITGGKVSLQAAGNTFNVAAGTTPNGVDLSVSSNLINYSGNTTNTLTKSGAGYMLLSGANTYTGATSVTAGTFAVSGTMGATAITTSGTGTLALLNTGAVTASTVTLGGGTLALRSDTNNASFTTANSNTFSLTGSSTINVDQLSTGTNNTLALGTIAVPNTSADILTISGGHGYAFSLGTLKLPVTTGQTTTLVANANTTITGGVVNGETSGFATGNFDTLVLGGIGTQNAIQGTIADSTAGSRTLGAYTPVTVTGATWTLSGTNTYSGNTTVSGGTLIAANTQALGSNLFAANGEVVSLTGGTLDLAIDTSIKPYNTTVGGITTIASDKATTASPGITHTLGTLGIGATTLNVVAGANVSGGSPTIAFGATTLTAGSGTTTLIPTSANLTLASVTSNAAAAATDTLTLDGTSTGNTILGGITNSAAGTTALNKNNLSTWTISGASTYTGPTSVNAGTLALVNSGSLAKTAMTVNNSGTFAALAGSGALSSAGSISLNSGSTFTMVDGSTGTFNLTGTGTGTGLTVNTGSLLSLELSSDTALSDTLNVSGPVTVASGGGKISLVGLGTSAPNSSTVYTLISAPGGGLNTGGGFALTNRAVMFGGTAYTATLTDTSTAVTVSFNPATGLAVAYWTGNQAGTWSTTGVTSAGATNWSTDSAGLNDAGQQPTSVTDVYFTASGAGNLSSTVDAPYDFNSLNFNSSPGGPVIINGSGTTNTLSLEAGGLTVLSGAPAVTVNAPLVLKSSQTWTNNSSNGLSVGGTVSEGANRLNVAGSGSITLSNTITGSGGFTANGTGLVALSGANTFTGGVAINGGTVQLGSSTGLGATANVVSIASGATLDLNGQTITQTLTITGTGVGASGALINSNTTTPGSFSTNLANAGGFTVGGPGAITLSGQMSGQTLTKIGAGTLTLAGTTDNNSGSVTANGGLVILAKTSTSGVHATSGLTVNTGGTAQLGGTGGDQIYDSSAVTINGGTLDLNGKTETIGGFNGTLSTGVVTNTNATPATLTIGNANAAGAYAGALQNGAGTVALTKIGTAAQTLSGTNTYSGPTSINAGSISISAASALSPNSIVTVASAAQLGITASGTYASQLALTGDFGVANFDPAASAGALRLSLSGGTFTLTGGIGLATAAAANTEISAYSTATSTASVAGPITGGSSTGTFYLGGGGSATTNLQTFVVSNAGNTYAGNTTLLGHTAGVTLQLAGGDNRLPVTTNLTLQGDYSGTTALRSWLDLNGTNQTLAGLTSATTSLSTAGTPGDNRVGNSSATLSTLTLAPAGANSFGGVLGGGPGNNFALTMAGAGTLTLTANNTYTGGTNVNSGVLIAGNAAGSATGTGTVAIAGNGALAGNGFISGPVNVNGAISAGSGITTTSTTGKLTTTGQQTWNNGGTYAWKLNTNNSAAGSTSTLNGATLYTDTSGANWDQLAVSSLSVAASSPSGFTIQVIGVSGANTGSTFTPAQSYQWIAATVPAASLTGNFAGAFNVATSGFSGYSNLGSFSAAYQLDPSNSSMDDLVVDYSPAPEPTSLSLLGIVAGALMLRRRRASRGTGFEPVQAV